METVPDLCALGSVLTLQGLGTLLPQGWLLLPLLFSLGKKATKLSGEGSSVDVIKWGDLSPEDGARRKWKFNRCLITSPTGRPAPLSG